MGWMTAANLGTDGYTGDLNERCLTIAECLQPAGYATYMSGKWHLTYEKYCGPEGPKHSWPRQRGLAARMRHCADCHRWNQFIKTT